MPTERYNFGINTPLQSKKEAPQRNNNNDDDLRAMCEALDNLSPSRRADQNGIVVDIIEGEVRYEDLTPYIKKK